MKSKIITALLGTITLVPAIALSTPKAKVVGKDKTGKAQRNTSKKSTVRGRATAPTGNFWFRKSDNKTGKRRDTAKLHRGGSTGSSRARMASW